MSYAMKPSLLVKQIDQFRLYQDVKCALSHSIGLTENQRQWPYDVGQHHAAKKWSIRVTPLFPNPRPVLLFAGPQA
jgi:hypothetical protein